MTRKIRTTMLALVAAFSIAGSVAPAAQAMPRDFCAQQYLRFEIYSHGFDSFIRSGGPGDEITAQNMWRDAVRTKIAASIRGCDTSDWTF
jgi:hypothetical protein